jgi:hypothetical protein
VEQVVVLGQLEEMDKPGFSLSLVLVGVVLLRLQLEMLEMAEMYCYLLEDTEVLILLDTAEAEVGVLLHWGGEGTVADLMHRQLVLKDLVEGEGYIIFQVEQMEEEVVSS